MDCKGVTIAAAGRASACACGGAKGLRSVIRLGGATKPCCSCVHTQWDTYMSDGRVMCWQDAQSWTAGQAEAQIPLHERLRECTRGRGRRHSDLCERAQQHSGPCDQDGAMDRMYVLYTCSGQGGMSKTFRPLVRRKRARPFTATRL